MSALIGILLKFAFFRVDAFLGSVSSRLNSGVEVEASISMGWLVLRRLVIVRDRCEGAFFVRVVTRGQDFLFALLVLLLSNLFLLVNSINDALVARLSQEFLATLLCKSLTCCRNFGCVVQFLQLWVFDLLLRFTFKLHSVRMQAHKMLVNLSLTTFADKELRLRSFFIIIVIFLVKRDSLDSCWS